MNLSGRLVLEELSHINNQKMPTLRSMHISQRLYQPSGGEHKDHLWWKRKRWKLRRIEYVFLSTQVSLIIN